MTDNLAVRVLYFAWLREKIGQPEEQIVLASPLSVRELISHLAARSPAHQKAFGDLDPIQVAINQKLATMNAVVEPGDELALFPPVTGG